MRKMLYAYIVFYFKDEEYTLFQIVLNIILSLFFAFYLAYAQPFVSSFDNKIQLLNEVTYYSVSVLYLCFTDFNPNPSVKI